MGMTVTALAMGGVGTKKMCRIRINETLTASTQTDRFAHDRQAGGDYE